MRLPSNCEEQGSGPDGESSSGRGLFEMGRWQLLLVGLGLNGCIIEHHYYGESPCEAAAGAGADSCTGGSQNGSGGSVAESGGGGNGETGGQGGQPDAVGGSDSGASNSGGSESGGSAPVASFVGPSAYEGAPPSKCDDSQPRGYALHLEADDEAGNAADAQSPARLFDGNSGTSWIVTNSGTPALGFRERGEEPTPAHAYEIVSKNTAASPAPYPTSWELLGRKAGEDGEEWIVIDAQMDEAGTRPYERLLFEFGTPQAFESYQLKVLENGGAPHFELAELVLYSEGLLPIVVDDSAVGDGVNEFTYSALWSGHSYDSATERHNGTSSWTGEIGAWAELTFEGTGVELYVVHDPGHGHLIVSLDEGEEQLIDLYGANTKFNVLAYRSERLCTGEHVLHLEVAGDRSSGATGHFVSIDKAVVFP